MSASREKKQRRNDPSQGLTQKQRAELDQQMAAKRKAKAYVALGVIVAVLVVVLLVWHSGIFQRRVTAVSVGGRNYTATDVQYYYRTAMISEYYAELYSLGTVSFDLSGDLKTQYVDEEQTQSYHDYFLEQAMDDLTEVAALENAADEAGYTLDEAGKAEVEENIASNRASAEQSGYPNFAGFLKANFGRFMTVNAYKTCVERQVRTDNFKAAYLDQVEVTQEDIQAYYDENPASLDSFDFRYLFISGSAPSTTDADGNTVAATDEEKEQAMAQAKEKADALVAALKASDDPEATFIELAPDYVSEASKQDYIDNPDTSLTSGMVGGTLANYTYGSWLMDDARAAGDAGVVESTSGYYVVLLLDRYLDETPTADIRHILIKAELTQEDDPATTDVDESTVPTQEALDAAKAEAESLLAQWEAGDKTAESFGELANANSDDPGSNQNGGLYEKVYEGYFTIFDEWLFGQAHQSGDTALIENTNSGQQGWCVVYYQGENDPVWMSSADDALRTQAQTDWLDGLMEGLQAVQGDGIKYVKA